MSTSRTSSKSTSRKAKAPLTLTLEEARNQIVALHYCNREDARRVCQRIMDGNPAELRHGRHFCPDDISSLPNALRSAFRNDSPIWQEPLLTELRQHIVLHKLWGSGADYCLAEVAAETVNCELSELAQAVNTALRLSSNMRDDINKMNGDIAKMSSDVTRMDDSVGKMDGNIVKMDANNSKLDGNLNDMVAQLTAISGQLAEAEKGLQMLEAQHREIEDNLKGHAEGLRAIITSSFGNVSEMSSAVDKIRQSQQEEKKSIENIEHYSLRLRKQTDRISKVQTAGLLLLAGDLIISLIRLFT